ncbi:DHH family phosphoesterase [Poseidonibacter ostreae]|uniref:DDH domain-containing protein n=1 Tax=Poseidonibacter ostreae TaxID=2654171 RepID=A0A6L4WW73_9BACT|nr:DHH family phosphoesterase [Poseidonibacter ostreae]KAB7891312.1 hypothetical protein GBG19_00315 [Poseidonibacter ostreae]
MRDIQEFNNDFLDDFLNLSDEKLKIDRNITSKFMKQIYKQIVLKNRILLCNDYDVDGFLGGLSLYSYLKLLEIRVNGEGKSKIDTFYNKRSLGYEIPEEKFNSFAEDYDLIVLIDTGSSYSYFNENTENVLVIDHHPIKEDVKDISALEYIYNPNVNNTISTSSGRVVYEMIESFEDNMRDFFGKDVIKQHDILKVIKMYAGITICSDMAKMSHDNKIFLKESLDLMSDNKDSLVWLKDVGSKNISAMDISFNLINKINSYSRMNEDLKDIEDVFKFKIERDCIKSLMSSKKILSLWEKLESIHEKRKDITFQLENTLFENLDKTNTKDMDCIVNVVDNSFSGINGLLSQTVLNSTLKSNLVVSFDESKDLYVGSGRGDMVKKSLEVLKNDYPKDKFFFGGHEMAVGITIKKDFIDEFVDRYNKLDLSKERENSKNENIKVYETNSIKDYKEANEYYLNLSPTTNVDKKYFVELSNYENLGIAKKNRWYKSTLVDDTASVTIYFKENDVEKIQNNSPILLEIMNSNDSKFLQNMNLEDFNIEPTKTVGNQLIQDADTNKEVEEEMEEYFMGVNQ